MNLTIERPYEEPQVIPWGEGARRRFKINTTEQEVLEAGETLFRGETAFSLTEDE